MPLGPFLSGFCRVQPDRRLLTGRDDVRIDGRQESALVTWRGFRPFVGNDFAIAPPLRCTIPKTVTWVAIDGKGFDRLSSVFPEDRPHFIDFDSLPSH